MIEVYQHADREAAAEVLAQSVAASLRGALAARSRASLVVSGGTTPLPFFERLRRCRLPWERVHITLADERWVPTDHPESNERGVRETLLAERAAGARFTGLKTPAADPGDARAECEARVAALRPFAVVLLGMGADGHVASIFPSDPGLPEALALDSGRSCVAVAGAAGRRPRLSLTLPALLDSRRVVLYFTGEEKWRTYQRAAGSGADGDLPVRALLRAATRGIEVVWAP